MSELDTETAPEIDPIEVIHLGECLSLSGRSTLTYEIGRHISDETLHLRVADNSGGGMWCKDWASASAIHDVVLGEVGLTSKNFLCLHEGRSINTGGFVLAALRDLGLISANEQNSRVHEHCPTSNFQGVATARMAESMEQVPKSSRRKTKEG